MSVLIESQYLPPIATFALLNDYDTLCLDYHSNYVKGSYRNRCYILGVNGRQILSVPLVKGKHQKTPMGEVKISYEEDWQKLHWQSIISAYGRSPFFEFYEDEFKMLLFKPYDLLIELNTALLKWMLKQFQLSIDISITESYLPKENKPSDFRDLIHPQSSKMEYQFLAKPYEQVFNDRLSFEPNLSSIDLLFTQGPSAKQYI